MKLISMTSFVLEQNKNLKIAEEIIPNYKRIVKYAEFLNQPLTLGMFVPCDENGNVLNEPINYDVWEKMHKTSGSTIGFSEHENYLKAKEKVLFEFERVNPQDIMDQFSTIEDMANFYEPELTESALKQIGLNP